MVQFYMIIYTFPTKQEIQGFKVHLIQIEDTTP